MKREAWLSTLEWCLPFITLGGIIFIPGNRIPLPAWAIGTGLLMLVLSGLLGHFSQEFAADVAGGLLFVTWGLVVLRNGRLAWVILPLALIVPAAYWLIGIALRRKPSG